MKNCFACAREVDDADRYCGVCGADQTLAPAVPAQEPQAAVDAPADNTRRIRGVLVVLVAVGLAALGGLAWLVFGRGGEASVLRYAFDRIGIVNSAGEVQEPVEEPTEEPTDEPEEEQPEQPAALATGPDGAIFLQPGRWQFTTQLVAISKVNPNDDFEINRQGIGANEAHSVCITPAASENPRAIAFPFQQGLACSPSGFDMSNGNYSSRMTCSFPQFGGRRPVSASGQYSRSTASLSVNVTVPAQVVEGDFDEPPEIVMQYRMQGYLTGPC